jgi:uncharacterized membrane protein YoaT (DUF817 family)
MNHYAAMFLIMLLAGFLSTMNLWANQLDDVRWSINDLYMTLAMTGWMFFFMGLHDRKASITLFGLILLVLAVLAIRTQAFVGVQQYLLGMIPHHSMAVHMSQRLLQSGQDLTEDQSHFLERLIHTQEEEIRLMKAWSAE